MIVGLDAGTSVVKAVAFGPTGEALAVAARPTKTLTPAPGRAEQDLEEVIAAVGAVLREVTAETGDDVDLLGVTGQGDGLWLLDAEGNSVRPAILWSDARAADVVAEWLASGLAARVFRRSANMTFPGAAAPLLLAVGRDEPSSLARAATAAYCKDAIVQRLTGARATDASDASLPFLDIRTRHYDPALIELVGLDPVAVGRLLPPLDPHPGPLRPISATGAHASGLPIGTPVHTGPFDLCATMIGAGIDQPGDGLVILGTTLGCAVLFDEPPSASSPAGMTLCLPSPDRWVRVMPAMVGTPSLEWALRLTGIGRDVLDKALAATEPGAGGVVALPLLSPAGERAPFVDPAARGALLGLSLETSPNALVRAICEGIAYAARHCLDAAGLAPTATVTITGGGARSPGWRQILADILNRPLRLAREPEVGARGAALAALAAADLPHDAATWTQPDGFVEPNPRLTRFYDDGYAYYRDRLTAAAGAWSGPSSV